MKTFILSAGTMAIVLLGGCASVDKCADPVDWPIQKEVKIVLPPQNEVEVILLPQADGKVGKVTVSDGGKETTLDQAWQRVETKNLDNKEILSKEDVESKYGLLLEAMAEKMKNYSLHFKYDSPDMTDESIAVFRQIIEDMKSEYASQIELNGYSDRAGDEAYNKTLSMKRAQKVLELLKNEGVSNDVVSVNYYGEANSVVPTEDGVANESNRRVEVSVK